MLFLENFHFSFQDEHSLRTALMCFKVFSCWFCLLVHIFISLILQHKMKNVVWTRGTGGLEGEFQATSEIDFYIDNDMVHIADTKVARRYGDFFIRNIHKFEEVRTCEVLLMQSLGLTPSRWHSKYILLPFLVESHSARVEAGRHRCCQVKNPKTVQVCHCCFMFKSRVFTWSGKSSLGLFRWLRIILFYCLKSRRQFCAKRLNFQKCWVQMQYPIFFECHRIRFMKMYGINLILWSVNNLIHKALSSTPKRMPSVRNVIQVFCSTV